MKSIVYLSDGERRNIPRLIEHEDWHCPRDAFNRDDRYRDHYFGRRVACIIRGDMNVHERINRRAEDISQTAWHIWHRLALPPGQYGRKWGRDYQWYVGPERIARSRFRKARREDRTGRKATYGARGYATIDFSFGLSNVDTRRNLNSIERDHIQARLEVAATSRAPLPIWHLSDCWQRQAAA